MLSTERAQPGKTVAVVCHQIPNRHQPQVEGQSRDALTKAVGVRDAAKTMLV